MTGWQLDPVTITLTCGRCGYTKREMTEIDDEGAFFDPGLPDDWRKVHVDDPTAQKTWNYQLCPTCAFELSEFIKDGTTTPTPRKD